MSDLVEKVHAAFKEHEFHDGGTAARAAIAVVLREMMEPSAAARLAGAEMMPVVTDYKIDDREIKATLMTEHNPRFVPCTEPYQAMLRAFAAENGKAALGLQPIKS
jgi:uncharacterized protein (DUF2267 family)